jgi:hypothetical protein
MKFRSRLILVTFALSPIIFIISLFLARTGRDLTTLLSWGSGALFVLGVFVVAVGYWKGKPEWTLSGVVLLVLLVFLFLAGSTKVHWIGAETTDLVITVLDAKTHQPIPNASVRLFGEIGDPGISQGKSDDEGRVHLSHTFTAVGTDLAARRTGAIYLWRTTVQIDADGYKQVQKPLDRFADSSWDLYGLPLPVVEVRLNPVPGRKNPRAKSD